jgi:TonB-dependent starch-binding outer membrane protein SusC
MKIALSRAGSSLSCPLIKQLLLAMKLTVFLILVTCLHVSATGVGQNITLSVKDASLESIFTEIIRQSGTTIVYDDVSLKNAKPVTVNVTNATPKEVLDLSLKGQPFFYTREDGYIIVKSAVLSNVMRSNERPHSLSLFFLNTPPVSGAVRGSDGQPITGANIVIKGAKKGTVSDNKGEFIIEAKDGDHLIISSIGYDAAEITINGSYKLPAITLNRSESKLDEVQIIAYGQTSKRLNTGNVVTVKADDIEKQPVSNPLLALQGRVPGMEITQTNGLPGSEVKIQIRGKGSLTQGTSPLYIIDGVPYNSKIFASSAFPGIGGIQGLNPFSFLNPTDIESIDILKDADATAIYGSRAANGVVLITTKKGKTGKTKFNANIQSGTGKIIHKAKLMNTQQYLAMRKEAFSNDNITPDITNARDLVSWDQNAYTDWQDIMIGGTAKYNDAQASVSGGNSNTQFVIGGGYHKETTVFPHEWGDQKGSLHFSINNSSLNQKFKITLSGNYINDNNRLPNQDFTQFITLAPNAPSLTLSNGELDLVNYTDNPFRTKRSKYQVKTRNLISNAIISYNILPGLDIKSSFGYSSIQLVENSQLNHNFFNPIYGITTGFSSFNNNFNNSWIIEPQINYRPSIGNGKLDILLGATAQQRESSGQVIDGSGYTNDELLGALAAAATINKGQTSYEQYKYNSLFTRIGYNLSDKYLINLTGRRDGSSRFGPGKQFGNFGAIGAAWIFSNESFLKKICPQLSYGKLRASYGTSGNEPGDSYQYLELYNFIPDNPYLGGPGVNPINFPTPDFAWEVNRKLEVGLELGVFNDKVLITASYYQNRSSNQLVSYNTPNYTGFTNVISNLPAKVQNNGWEFTLNTQNIQQHHFRWSTSFNITAPRNKLLAFPDLDKNIYYKGSYQIGKPITADRVYSFAGVDGTSGIYQFYNKDGDIIFNPSLPSDNIIQVNTSPKFYGGLQNSFQVKQFSLDINIQYTKVTGKNYLFNFSNPGYFLDGIGNMPVELMERWQKPGDVSLYEKYSTQYSPGRNSAAFSDVAYTDASYIRVKNVSLSYSLPTNILKRSVIEALRIYIHAQNLFTITSYSGVDPENQSLLSLPPLRTVTAGIQFTL